MSSRSEKVRMNSRISAAISSRARPTNGAIPSSVARLYSSSITIGDTLLTRSGPSLAVAASLMVRSASRTLLSPVSAQADGGDRDRCAVGVVAGQGGERPTDLGDACDGVDLRLGDRCSIESTRGLDQHRRGNDRVGRRQQLGHARLADDAVEERVHLGEPAGCERLAPEDQGHHTGVAGFPEEFVELRQRSADGAVGGKVRHVGALSGGCPPRCPRGQHHGEEDEDEDGDDRPGGDQPAEPVERAAHGSP